MTGFSEIVATTVKLHAAKMAQTVCRSTALMSRLQAWSNRNKAIRSRVVAAYDAGAAWANGLRHDARA